MFVAFVQRWYMFVEDRIGISRQRSLSKDDLTDTMASLPKTPPQQKTTQEMTDLLSIYMC